MFARALFPLTLLVALIPNASAQEEIPSRFLPTGGYTPPSIAPLREDPRWTSTAPAQTPPRKTKGHVASLRADPLHESAFWVERVVGDENASRTIVVIPQFHRSDTQPIDWTSLGKEIREVQRHIDDLVTRLVYAHDLRCIGTEGSALNDIGVPMELKQLAGWKRDLDNSHAAATALFAERGEELVGPLRTVASLLDDAMRKRLVILDGAGIALSRLSPTKREHVRRFGLEDLKLNESGVTLLRTITALEEKLALLEPATQSTTAGVMGLMWLDEYPPHQASVLDPFDVALTFLDVERKSLLNQGALDAADALRRFTSRSKLIASGLIRSDEIRGYHSYYAKVDARQQLLLKGDAGPIADTGQPKKLTRAEKKAKRRLTRKRDRLWKKYESITNAQREVFAAKRILAALPKKEGAICAAVMGANHSDALVDALVRTAPKDVAVVVVAPFRF